MKLRIKEVLKAQKITAVFLAERIGIAQPSMSNIINGKVTPSLDTLERISIVLGVSVSELIDEPKPDIGLTCPNCGATLDIDIHVSGERKIPDHENIRGAKYYK